MPLFVQIPQQFATIRTKSSEIFVCIVLSSRATYITIKGIKLFASHV